MSDRNIPLIVAWGDSVVLSEHTPDDKLRGLVIDVLTGLCTFCMFVYVCMHVCVYACVCVCVCGLFCFVLFCFVCARVHVDDRRMCVSAWVSGGNKKMKVVNFGLNFGVYLPYLKF